MLIAEPLCFIKNYLRKINNAIEVHCPGNRLSRIQQHWLAFCIMAIIVTNSVCWARFERASIGKYSLAALSWMFLKSKIPWDQLLQISVTQIIRHYGIVEGILAIDETEKKRAKSTKKIFNTHKIKDKSSGGYINGQSVVFLVLITKKITIPVGFSFYMPDPQISAWRKADKRLKKQGVAKKDRPAKPATNNDYPTKSQIGLNLFEQFKNAHRQVHIQCIVADTLYGNKQFFKGVSRFFGGIQVISQIRYNQLVRFKNKKFSVERFFKRYPAIKQSIRIRGEQVTVTMASARLHVHAYGKKCFVIALKYEGENEYRYIIASDLSWRATDIAQAYTLRWLVEVFFQDWKANEGWGQLTKQQGEEGSKRSLILSLLADHSLFFHPDQLARIENKLPAYTVGSLTEKIKVQGLLRLFEQTILSDSPVEEFKALTKAIEDNVIVLNPSKKHMINRDLGNFQSSPHLKYKNAA